MTEPQEPQTEWTAAQVKEYVDGQLAEMRRAVDVAREGVPPHVTIQYHLETVLDEREKAVQLALTAADKLEQERLARNTDLITCERRVAELTRQLSETAILKAEHASDKRFDEFSKTVKDQIDGLRTTIDGLTRRIDQLV